MSRKHVLVLLLLVLVIGGIGVVMFKRDIDAWSGPDKRLGERVLPKLDVSEIAQIHIKHKKDELNVVYQDGTWRVKERGGFPADPALVSELTFKAREWKVVQSEPITEAQRPRVDVAPPEAEEGASTLLEFRDKEGKVLATLYLGRKHLGKPPLQVKGFDKGQPDGRYLVTGADPKTLMVVSDPMNNVVPDAQKWISKEFAKVDRIKHLKVDSGDPATSYELSREEESGDWLLAGVRADQTNPSAAVSATNALYTLSFVDVAPDLKPAQLEKPARITAETFDGWSYTMQAAPKPGDDAHMHFTLAVTGDVKRSERKPVKDEKPEEKEKRDKEHEERFKRLEAQLAREKTFDQWVFVVDRKMLAPLLRSRSRFIEEPEKPAPGKK
ncbi:MAG: DUF4340 domain-containing protein [Betaproteobacteria bacterium]|nr:DUF4340 domain-containing protein [Betaproteobacteria bacterium]